MDDSVNISSLIVNDVIETESKLIPERESVHDQNSVKY